MKLVIQRVTQAQVTVDGNCVGSIGKGFMVLWGAGIHDTKKEAEYLAGKLMRLRVFEDENGKMNRSIQDVDGELLVISQFTLYADCKKGNRPSFTEAMPPVDSEAMYEYFLSLLRQSGKKVEKGIFGADMQVALINDGPVTIVMDTEKMMA